MSGKLNVFNIGASGVNVDMNPVQLEDGELTKSQNAIHDLESGTGGSLKNRRGLIKINSIAAAGSINGAIGVPISVGTAGNTGEALSPAVSPDVRTYLVGRRINATTSGWNTSTDLFTASVTTGGPDDYDAAADPRVPDYLWPGMLEDPTHHKYRAFRSGRPGVMFQNRFYYAGNDYTYQSTSPTIRMYDGVQDVLLGRVPSRNGVVAEAVINMIVGADELIYFNTHDAGVYNANTMKARVFQLDPETGEIRQVGAPFPISPETVRVPYALAWHQGRLWARTHGGGISAGNHLMYYIRPDIDTAWSSESVDESVSTAGGTSMVSYKGQLFTGTVEDQNYPAYIEVRSPLGVHTISKTIATGDGSVPFGSFGYGNHVGAMAVFGGNLYASYFNQQESENTNAGDKYFRIYKYDGTNWTVVYNPAANDATAVPYSNAVVIGGRIFFISAPARTSSNTHNRILYSADGSAWTAVTEALLDDVSTSVFGAIAS